MTAASHGSLWVSVLSQTSDWGDAYVNISVYLSQVHGYSQPLFFAVLSLFLGNLIVHGTHTNITTIQFRVVCLAVLYTYFIFFAVLFFLMFCSVLFCVFCANADGFSISLSCECAYVIRSPPTQKSVPLSQRARWESERDALHCLCLSSMCYFLLSLSRAFTLSLWFPAFPYMLISGKSVGAQHHCR